MPEPPSPGIPQIRDLRSKIEGLLPKNMQARILGALSALMIAVITFSGRSTPKERPVSPAPVLSAPSDANQERIRAYRAQIEEQTRKLAAEQAQLAQAKQALGVSPNSPAIAASDSSPSGAMAAGSSISQPYREDPRAEWRKREIEAPFASNIALTHRQAPRARDLPVAQLPHAGPSLGSKRDAAEITAKRHRIFEGTVIEAVLVNRLDGSFSGPVICMVTNSVYSHDRQRLLIPQGTRILGKVAPVESLGQERLAVVFHRMIMPDGFSVDLNQFQGLNQIGETALRDQVNHHYLRLFGVSIAIGALAGLGQINTRSGSDASGFDAYGQGVAASLSQSSLRILDRFLNVLPTVTIHEGHRVKVYLAADLLLPAYEEHSVFSDL